MTNVIALPGIQALQRPLRAVLYARVSNDRKKRRTSTRDQFIVGEMECETRGWEIVGYFEDVDLSATRRARKVREDFNAMVAMVERGDADVIVYAEKARLARMMEVGLQIRNLCDRTGALVCYEGRVYDMQVQGDRRDFTRDCLSAEEEGESIGGRVDRTSILSARRGHPHGPCPVGYRRRYDPDDGLLIGQEVDPVLGPVVAEAFNMIDQGKSVGVALAYVRRWLPTLTRSGIRNMLRNKTYLGIRKHKGQEYDAEWPALIDAPIFHRVQALMDDPERGGKLEAKVSLLSYHAKCGVCRRDPGAGDNRIRNINARLRPEHVVSGKTYPARWEKAAYGCAGRQDVRIPQDIADAIVEEAVLAWLSSPAAARAFRTENKDSEIALIRTRCAAIQQQLDEAHSMAGIIDPTTGLPALSVAALVAMEQTLIPQLQQEKVKLEKLLSAGDPTIDQLINAGQYIDVLWNTDLTMDQRRSVLQKVVRVEIGKAPRRGRYQEADAVARIGLIFRGEPGFDEWPKLVIPEQATP